MTAQHKRVKKNRVSITYDVETNGAKESKELPFVVGVIGDFSGDKPDDEKIDSEEREFLKIDKDNFDSVMKRIGPKLDLNVDNKLTAAEGKFDVSLDFNSMADFHPETVLHKIPVLQEMMKVRAQLKEILSKADRSRDFERLLREVLRDPEKTKKVAEVLKIEAIEEKTD